jgi:hypothetical protein
VSQAAYSYEIYHTWQAYFPMAICLVGVLEHSQGFLKASFRRIFLLAVVLAVFILGLGARLGLAMTDLKERDYSKVESFVRATVRPSDIVYADYQAFYPLHKLNVTAYYSWYFHVITPQEADSIDCLVIDPAWLGTVKDKLGGDWYATGESYLNGNKFNIAFLDRLLPHYFTQQTNEKYNLVVYRRRPNPGAMSGERIYN